MKCNYVDFQIKDYYLIILAFAAAVVVVVVAVHAYTQTRTSHTHTQAATANYCDCIISAVFSLWLTAFA